MAQIPLSTKSHKGVKIDPMHGPDCPYGLMGKAHVVKLNKFFNCAEMIRIANGLMRICHILIEEQEGKCGNIFLGVMALVGCS